RTAIMIIPGGELTPPGGSADLDTVERGQDAPPRKAGSRATAALAIIGIIGTAYAVAAILVVHWLRPEEDPLSSPISQYAVGRFGFVMNAALFLWGVASWALTAGLF